VAAKSEIRKDPDFFFFIVKDILADHKRFLEFNKNLVQRALRKRSLMYRQKRKQSHKKKSLPEEVRHFVKSEQDLTNLIEMCEPLNADQVKDLLAFAEPTPFNYVKVYLLEKMGDYVKCLQTFLQQEGIEAGTAAILRYYTE